MKTTTYILIGLMAAGSIAMAGSVTIPNSFSAGETAKASEVNENFSAVKTAVDGNVADIATNKTAMSAKQDKVTGVCAAGSSIREINSDGTVICETDTDTDTTYTAGTGMTLTGTQFSVDTTATQKRVSSTCPAGQSIRAIADDGTVTCEADTDTTYTAGIGMSLTGTQFSVDTTTIQKRVATSCGAGHFMVSIDVNGIPTCAADSGGDITAVTAGTGLQGGGDSGNIEIKRADGYISLFAAAFSPNDPDNCLWKQNDEYGYFDAASANSCVAYASVVLPDHATVTSLECSVYKNDGSSTYPKIHLYRLSGTVSKNKLGQVFWHNDLSAYQQVETQSFNYAGIDNEHYAYFLKYEPYTAGEDFRVSNCRINYTY